MKRFVIISIIILAVAGAILGWKVLGRGKTPEAPPVATPPVVQVPKPPITKPAPIPDPERDYTTITLITSKPGAELIAAVGKANVASVLAMNRIDDAHLWKGITLTVPVDPEDGIPYRYVPDFIEAAQTIPKLIIVSQEMQSFGLYENGQLIRSGPVSSGKESTPTPSRLFFTNWKGKEVISSISDEWILKWNFNIANYEGVSLHQYALPGYPASHSCVRFYAENAEFIFNWADQWILSADGQTKIASGTPVIIYGEYNFENAAPWKKLPLDSHATEITADELNALVNENLPEITKEKELREQILGHF